MPRELSTGAADDLVRATELAREMVMRYGMDATVGNAVYRDGSIAPESRLYSEQTARDIESAVRGLLQGALDRAIAILTLNRTALDDGAKRLLDRETLTRDQLPPVTPAPEEEAPRVSVSVREPLT